MPPYQKKITKGLKFVQILLQDSSLYALVDTGSTISLAGQELFDMFPNLTEHLQDYKGTAKNVCSEEFQFDGEVPVTFDLAGHTFTVSLCCAFGNRFSTNCWSPT